MACSDIDSNSVFLKLLTLCILSLFCIAVEPKKAYATGRGLQAKGIRMKDNADIMVHTEAAGPAELTGTLVGPTGNAMPYIMFVFVKRELYVYTQFYSIVNLG